MTALALLGMVFSYIALRLSWPMRVYKRMDFDHIITLSFLSLLMFAVIFILSLGVKW